MMSAGELAGKQRIVWLDVLRVLSAFAIVFLHTSSVYLDGLIPYGTFSWFGADLYLAASRYAVPVFVMISGVFFLNPGKDITIKNIYGKYVPRMLTVLLGWAFIRTAMAGTALDGVPAGAWASSFFTSVKMYWFLPMIIGLYLITPVLRAVTALNNRKLLVYFMTLSVVLAMCVPVAEGIQLYYFPKAVPVTDFTNLLKLPCLIFGAHFVFGYYAYTYDLSRRAKTALYVCAIASWLLIAAGTYVFFKEPASKMFFFSMHGASLSPLTFLTGAAVFVFCKDRLGRIGFSAAASSFIRRLAYYSLGVYMLHIILVEAAVRFGMFKYVSFVPVVMIPLAALVIFAVSNAIIAGLYRMKWFRRYFL